MPRRGENIYKRKDGRWEGRYIKSHLANGKAKYGYVYAESYKHVKLKLQSITENDYVFERSSLNKTYSELLYKWLQSKRITVKESTFTRYQRIVEVYLVPSLGTLSIDSLSTICIEEFIQKMLDSGRLDGKGGLSAKTVSDILIIIKSTLQYGNDNGYQIICNAKQISIKKKDKEMRVLTINEQSILSDFLRRDTDLYKLGILISLYTGIRIGELCALQWENIQLDQGVMIINKTLQRISTKGESAKTRIIITEPKSVCSVREIPLPKFLLPIIKQFYSFPKVYVITGDKTKYAEPRLMQYYFHKYINKCGIADANFHSLRHTFATRCVEVGFEIKSLSEILGHSNVNITLNRYVHSSFDMKAKNMNKLTF